MPYAATSRPRSILYRRPSTLGHFRINRSSAEIRDLVAAYPLMGEPQTPVAGDITEAWSGVLGSNALPLTVVGVDDVSRANWGTNRRGYQFNGVDSRGVHVSTPWVTNWPFTMMARVILTGSGSFLWFFAMGQQASPNRFAGLRWSGSAWQALIQGVSALGLSTGPSVAGAGVPVHVAGVFASATSCTCYVNGVSGATDTTNVGTFPTLDRSSIGCLLRVGVEAFFPGWIWDARIYSRALSASAIAAIARQSDLYVESRRRTYFIPEAASAPIDVDQTTEIDTAFPITALKAYAVDQAEESDSALPVVAQRTVAVGLASETDAAQAAQVLRSVLIGLAGESDDAFPVAVSGALAVGLASETDAALAATASRTKAVGLASESDAAFVLEVVRSLAIGLASETDSAFAISISGAIVVGLATELDQALAITGAKVMALGIALESDTALAATMRRAVALGLAGESDAALVLSAAKARTLGIALESDQALAITVEGGAVSGGALVATIRVIPAITGTITVN